MTLPQRRYYTPATDYTNVPFSPDLSGGLRAIPSVLDLPGIVELKMDNVSMSTSWRVRLESAAAARYIKLRAGKAGANGKGETVRFVDVSGQVGAEELGGEGGAAVKHYDADGRIALHSWTNCTNAFLISSCHKDPCILWDRCSCLRRHANLLRAHRLGHTPLKRGTFPFPFTLIRLGLPECISPTSLIFSYLLPLFFHVLLIRPVSCMYLYGEMSLLY